MISKINSITMTVFLFLVSFSACVPFHADLAMTWGHVNMYRQVKVDGMEVEAIEEDENGQIVVPEPILPEPARLRPSLRSQLLRSAAQ